MMEMVVGWCVCVKVVGWVCRGGVWIIDIR